MSATSPPKRKSKKGDLIAATVRLVAERGVRAATIRSIAEEAGVTEGALYRHYRTKDELCLDIYKRIVAEMIHEKERIVAAQIDTRTRLHDWVRVSYEAFDRHPQAFTYVLLTDHDFPESEREMCTRQGRLFMEMVRRAQVVRQMRAIAPELALSHFSGVMLNVPRMINAGTLAGPAANYTSEVSQAVWRLLRPE